MRLRGLVALLGFLVKLGEWVYNLIAAKIRR